MQNGFEPGLVAPALMERLEDVPQVIRVEPVEKRNRRVQFSDQVLPLAFANLADRHAHCGSPSVITVVHGGKLSGYVLDPQPQRVVPARTRDREPVEDVEIHVDLNKTARVPVQWD